MNPGEETPRDWEPMRIVYVGDVREVVQGGGGKLSQTGTDPGESRKTRGGGG